MLVKRFTQEPRRLIEVRLEENEARRILNFSNHSSYFDFFRHPESDMVTKAQVLDLLSKIDSTVGLQLRKQLAEMWIRYRSAPERPSW